MLLLLRKNQKLRKKKKVKESDSGSESGSESDSESERRKEEKRKEKAKAKAKKKEKSKEKVRKEKEATPKEEIKQIDEVSEHLTHLSAAEKPKAEPDVDLLTFNNFSETNTTDSGFQGFFSEPDLISIPTPTPPLPVAQSPPSIRPKPDIMSLFTQPQAPVMPPYSMPYAPHAIYPSVPPTVVSPYGIPTPTRRKVATTSDVMSLF